MVRIQSGFDDQTRSRGGAGDQADDGLTAYERASAPVLGNEAEEAVFDLVPFAGARREMADVKPQSQFVRRFCSKTFQSRER